MRFLRWNGLAIGFGALFVAALVGQAIAGNAEFNDEARDHHSSEVSFGRYITSAAFGNAVLENWQSEYLQFALFILATIWLIQRGSDRKSTRLNSSHANISYAVFCLKKKKMNCD